MARACGSYPQCQRFKSVRRYQLRPYGQAVKTPPFHGDNPGSSPGRVIFGSLAQLGEHLPYKQGVIGSSPIVSIEVYEHTFSKSNFLVIAAW